MSVGGEQKSQATSGSGAQAPWHALVLTLYPGMFPGPLGAGIVGRAVQDGAFALDTIDIRDFASDKHRTVDDLPFGGGFTRKTLCFFLAVLSFRLLSLFPEAWLDFG